MSARFDEDLTMDDTPRKIDASHIEVIGKTGEVIQEAEDQGSKPGMSGFSGIRVIQGGPALLLLLPIIIPIMIIGLIIMLVLALVFGKGIFKMVTTGLRRRS